MPFDNPMPLRAVSHNSAAFSDEAELKYSAIFILYSGLLDSVDEFGNLRINEILDSKWNYVP